jgi:hypothetical protein
VKDEKFIPRGFMCITCKHAFRNCSHLDFEKMQVINKYKDGYKEVKCVEFDKVEDQ